MENILLPLSIIVPTLFTVALIFHAFKFKLSNASSKANLPPGSFGWPIIGETFAFLNQGQEKFVGDRMKKHSPILFKTNILGEPTVVFCGNDGHKFISSNEEKLFCHGNQSPCRSFSPPPIKKLLRRPHHEQKVFISELHRVFSKLKLWFEPQSMDCMVQEHLKLHWDGKSRVELCHLAQLLVMTPSSRFFTGLQDNQERSAKLTRLTNVITSGLHTIPQRHTRLADKYSWSVALEVKRLVPPLQGTLREVITDFTYEGHTIPQGWKEYWSARTTNKNPENSVHQKCLTRAGLRMEKLHRLTLTSHLAAVLELVLEKKMRDSSFCVSCIPSLQGTNGKC